MANSNTTLPVIETVQVAWEKLYGAKATFWAAIGITFAISLGIGFIQGLLSDAPQALQVVLSIGITILQFLFNMGLIYIGIKRAEAEPITYKQLFYPFTKELALKLAILYLLQILVFLPIAGIIFLGGVLANSSPILPLVCGVIAFIAALFLAVRLALSWAFVLDQNLWAWEAIRASFLATRSKFWNILGIYLIEILIVVACLIPAAICSALFGGYGLIIGIPLSVAGLVWALPLGMIIYGLIYKKLSIKN